MAQPQSSVSSSNYGASHVNRDSIQDASIDIPRYTRLPKDVLELLERGEVDEALMLLARLQGVEEEVQTFWGRLGQNVMMAYTVPMQILRKIMAALKLSRIVKPADKLPEFSRLDSGLFAKRSQAVIQRYFLTPMRFVKNVTHLLALKGFQVFSLFSPILTLSVNVFHTLQKRINMAQDRAIRLFDSGMQFGNRIAQFVVNVAKPMVTPLGALAERFRENLRKFGSKVERFSKAGAETIQNVALQIVDYAAIPVISLFQAVSKVADRGMERYHRGAGKRSKRIKRFAAKIKKGVAVVSSMVFSLFSVILCLLSRLLGRIYTLLLQIGIQVARRIYAFFWIIWELSKFIGMLADRAYKSLRG